MKGLLKKCKGKIAAAYTAAMVWLILDSTPALAQGGVGQLGKNIAENAPGVASALQAGGFVGGFCFVLAGIKELHDAQKKQPNASFGGGAMKCAAGALLLGVGGWVTSASETIFGTDQSSGGMDGLGL